MPFTPPAGIYYPAHRVATVCGYHDSLHTILTEWSLVDIERANDLYDILQAATRPKSRR